MLPVSLNLVVDVPLRPQGPGFESPHREKLFVHQLSILAKLFRANTNVAVRLEFNLTS